MPWAKSFEGQESPLPNDILSSIHPGHHTCWALRCSTPNCQFSGGSSSSRRRGGGGGSSSCCCCCCCCCCGSSGRSSGRSNSGSIGSIVGTAAAVVVVVVVPGLLHIFVHATVFILGLVAHFPAIQNLNPGPPTARDGSMTPPRRRSTRWRVDSSQRLLRNILRPAHQRLCCNSYCRTFIFQRPSGCCNQKACGHPPTSKALCFRVPGSVVACLAAVAECLPEVV